MNNAGLNGTSFISYLREFAFRGLPGMYSPQDKLFVFRLKKTIKGIIKEGLSRRYTAIVLIGLAGEEESLINRVISRERLSSVCFRLVDDVHMVDNLGDVSLALWGLHAINHKNREKVWERLIQLKPINDTYPVVELSWALDALCLENDFSDNLSEQLANRLIASFNSQSGVFPHIVEGNGAKKGMRGHVSCFADMVYPIHALSNYYKLSGDRKALDAAVKCAETICRLQGNAGQWWWHYDLRTGEVIEGYPVYAIHQDAMAPMALFALKESGGPDYSASIKKGLDWLAKPTEIKEHLIDESAGLIWRKVARSEPGKLSRYIQATASSVHSSARVPGLDVVFPPVAIDYEDRPYHLGWLLYAWPMRRSVEWQKKEV